MPYNISFLCYRPVVQVLGFLIMLCSCSSSSNDDEEKEMEKSTRTLQFSGLEWVVRTSDEGKEGPGPNYFSDAEDNVWVDDNGSLHIKIVQKAGNWYCSGISLRRSLGYGEYIFYVSSRVDKLDPNVVGGLFTYMNDEEEIDIEFSRWSDPDNMDSQFAVQPSHLAGNKERYDLNLSSDLSTHVFDWQPDRIDFISLQGHGMAPDADNIISKWTYTGENIPPDNHERLKINLWLFRGAGPSDLKEQEMVIDSVRYIEK